MADAEVAQELGLGGGVVRNKRNQMKIAANYGITRNPDKWTPEMLARLGKDTLQKIADEMGVTREAVRQKRRNAETQKRRNAETQKRRNAETQKRIKLGIKARYHKKRSNLQGNGG